MKLAVGAAVVASASADLRREPWKRVGRSAATVEHRFTVGLTFKNFPGLHDKLMDISNPFSENYGQWLTKEEADAFTKPDQSVFDEVNAWATSTGARCTPLTEALRCYGSTAQVEELLHAEMSEFVHKTKGTKLHRITEGGVVPTSFVNKISIVSGLTQFPVPRNGNHRPLEMFDIVGNPDDADYAVVPSTLQMFYNITGWPLGGSASTQAPIEFQGQAAPAQSDTDAFAAAVGAKTWTIPKSQVVGPYSPSGQFLESTLDEEYIGIIGYNNAQWYWTEADWLFEYATMASNQPSAQLPAVHSVSYGWYELDQCDISPGVAPCSGQPVPAGSAAFVQATNQLFAKVGARGVTLIISSGDSGAHGRTDSGCQDPVTRPDYPGASPYVLTVGATEIANGVTGGNTEPICKNGTLTCASSGYEIVASNKVHAFFSSGGGFSTQALRPSWQDAVVSKYLTNASAIPPAADFNSTNRGYPDVAALGHNYFVYGGGSVEAVDGTSCSAPVWGGLIGNINNARLGAGKAVIGFAPPLIYAAAAANPAAFTDVVQGDNTCTEGACPCPANTGYYAAPGWDATTGLGTPNYGLLEATIDSITRHARAPHAKTVA